MYLSFSYVKSCNIDYILYCTKQCPQAQISVESLVIFHINL